jgi:hypothetical protein
VGDLRRSWSGKGPNGTSFDVVVGPRRVCLVWEAPDQHSGEGGREEVIFERFLAGVK